MNLLVPAQLHAHTPLNLSHSTASYGKRDTDRWPTAAHAKAGPTASESTTNAAVAVAVASLLAASLCKTEKGSPTGSQSVSEGGSQTTLTTFLGGPHGPATRKLLAHPHATVPAPERPLPPRAPRRAESGEVAVARVRGARSSVGLRCSV